MAEIYRELISSIAFYPALLAIFFLFLSVLSISFEYSAIAQQLKQTASFLFVDSKENARTVLNILAGSIISLTVFSFSMVMIVLNSASSALSPRVIPGLITRKSHQIVLGIYLGTIIYSIIMLINIKQSTESSQGVPSIGVLFALMLGLVCLALFVYFIHSISKAIQVDNVLNDLFKHTQSEISRLRLKQKAQKNLTPPDFDNWFSIKSNKAGYFKGVQANKLYSLLKSENIKILIAVKQGYFTVEGYPFLKCDCDLTGKDELTEKILDCFIFYIEEYISDHYQYGLTQISEIAVKAMSPGINDPATAVKAIDMLSILLIKRLNISDINYTLNQDDALPLLFIHEVSFAELIHDNFTPIRHYAKNDAYVMTNVLEAFKNIMFVANDTGHELDVIFTYLDAIIEDVNHHIHNPFDRQQIANMLTAITRINPNKSKQLMNEFKI